MVAFAWHLQPSKPRAQQDGSNFSQLSQPGPNLAFSHLFGLAGDAYPGVLSSSCIFSAFSCRKMVKARSLLKGKIPTSRSFSPARNRKKMTTTDAKADSPVAAVTDHMTKLQAAGSWDTDELSYEKHHAGEAKKGEPADGRPSLEDHHRGIFSIRKLHKQHKEKTHPLDWGYPGELSKEEVDCFVSDFCLVACAQFFWRCRKAETA